MTQVSGNIRCVRIFACRGSSCRHMRVGLSTTEIFGDLKGYFFGNFRNKANNITRRCCPVAVVGL